MLKKHAITFITLIGFLMLLAMVPGCQSGHSGEKPVADPDDGGRAVSPVSDNSGSEEGGGEFRPHIDDHSTNYSLTPIEGRQPDSPSTNSRMQEAEINIELIINGTRFPIDQPLYVHDGEQMHIEFALTATVSELESYYIESGAPVDIPNNGDLEGFSVIIPYTFTFNSRTWGDEGIIIRVSNRQGDIHMANVLVLSPLDGGMIRPPE